jgi:F0F1-type ATP synthase assembly protein I
VRALGIALSVGAPFAVLVSSGALGGWFLDRKLGTWPWLSLACSGLALAASVANALRVLSVMDRADRGGGPAPGDGPGRER